MKCRLPADLFLDIHMDNIEVWFVVSIRYMTGVRHKQTYLVHCSPRFRRRVTLLASPSQTLVWPEPHLYIRHLVVSGKQSIFAACSHTLRIHHNIDMHLNNATVTG